MKIYTRIFMYVLIVSVMLSCAGYTAYCLAPPATHITLDVLDSEEIRFFNNEREQLGKISDFVINIDDTITEKGITDRIIEMLKQTKEFNDKDEIGIMIFIQFALEGVTDTTVRQLVSSFGFSKKYHGKYCVPDNNQLRLLQASIAEVDEPSVSLMDLIATYEDYEYHEEQINEINEREKMYRECIRQISRGEYKQAERNLTSFLSDNYSTDDTFFQIVRKRSDQIQQLIAGNTIPASVRKDMDTKRAMSSLPTSQ